MTKLSASLLTILVVGSILFWVGVFLRWRDTMRQRGQHPRRRKSKRDRTPVHGGRR